MLPALLLVDDDIPSRNFLATCLGKQGFQVTEAGDAAEMRQRLAMGGFDVVLLDINLPEVDGLTLARELRLQSDIGIIMLTSRDGQMDRIAGLEWGADDYVVKTTPLAELIARIRSLLRRTGREGQTKKEAPAATTTIVFDGWTLDLDTRSLASPDGEPVRLTNGEFQILSTLARNLGRVLTRAELTAVISDHEWSGTDRSIDVMVGRLRRKLKDDPKAPARLLTVHGVGHRLIGKTESGS
ncbi:MAG: response regulator transcription factor [Alphaproteobacteria bacterium]|nr:response regulator transcription factor [Alphaproteobacteria bacterium]